MTDAGHPLDALRVLEASEGVAGAYAAKLLVDQGATVVKLERPGGDPLRAWSAATPDHAPRGDSALFCLLNASKHSVTAGDADRTQRVLRWADVVVAGAGAPELLGRAPGDLRRGRAELSVVTISPFGGAAWSADTPVNEFTLQGWCGLLAACGTRDGPPQQMGTGPGQWAAGGLAALGALSAVRWRQRCGQGADVEVSALGVMGVCLLNYPTLYGHFTGNPSALSRGLGDWPSVVRCKGGWIGLCIFTTQQWDDFAAMIGHPELIGDARLNAMGVRSRHRELAQSVVQPWLDEHTPEEIHELGGLFRIPVALIGDGRSVTQMDHFIERGTFVPNPAGFLQPRSPLLMGDCSPLPPGPTPVAGADSDRLGEILADPAAAATEAPATGAAATEAAGATGGGDGGARPLTGVTIVDLTAFWAGPAATHLLCALGADVIKIESHRHPDGMRHATVVGPDDPEWLERSPTFHATNPGKRSVCLDFSTPAGRELLLRLIDGADVVIENFTPRVLDNAGLGYDELRRRREDIILVRMPGFGLDGPWRDHSGFAQTMEQVSGLGWLTGRPGEEPLIRSTVDPITGIHAAFAVLAALEHRRRNGRGQLVEVPMAEVALNVAAEQVVTASAYGHVLQRQGDRGPGAPQGVYPCAGEEQWVALAVEDDRQWQALRALMGDPAWASAAALATRAGRRARHDDIDAGLTAWCSMRARDETVELVLGAGIPAAPVWDHMVLDRQPKLAGFFQVLQHPVMGAVSLPGTGLSAGQFDLRYRAAAPTLGQHTAEVLRERLRCSDEELAAWRAGDVIGPI